MPKSFWQSFLFTAIMAILMVLAMSTYNVVLHTGGKYWFVGWHNLLTEFLLAFPLALLVAGKIASTLAHKILKNSSNNAFRGIIITFFIALIMVTLMTSFVILRHSGWSNANWKIFGTAFISNFIVAFLLQIFVLKQVVAYIFRHAIGFKYKFREHIYKLNPFFNNPLSIVSVQAVMVSVMLIVCYVFLYNV